MNDKTEPSLVVGHRSSVVGCRLSVVVGCRLSVVGCRLSFRRNTMHPLSGATRLGHIAALLLVAVIARGCSVTLNPTGLRAAAVPIPGGAGGVGFDDMFYDSSLGKLVVPAGGTGNLDLIDPDS